MWGQDTVQGGAFWGVLNVSLCASGAQLGLDNGNGNGNGNQNRNWPLWFKIHDINNAGPILLKKRNVTDTGPQLAYMIKKTLCH